MSKSFEESDIPDGFLAATGSFASSVMATPRRRSSADTHGQVVSSLGGRSLDDSHDGSGANNALRQQTSRTVTASPTQQNGLHSILDAAEDDGAVGHVVGSGRPGPPDENDDKDTKQANGQLARTDTEPFENGYHFPPSHGFQQSLKLGLAAFWAFSLTPVGFFVVIYGLLVVAWGGMLFLLLLNAAPAMCHPSCNDINSPRRKWIEYDSQIVNALFCVTGFGLAPWRFRDLYFLLQYRLGRKRTALQRLAGIHRGWFRLEGSQALDKTLGPDGAATAFSPASIPPTVPIPPKAIPDAPLTGCRAEPTKVWKLDLVIWTYVWNTFMQCCLSGFMWGMNRYDRPSFAVGLFVGLAMVLAAIGGLQVFFEGKRVKGVEGVPLSDADRRRLALDRERGVSHYNNIKDKKPKPENKK